MNLVEANDLNTHEVIQPGEIKALTTAEVATAIKQLKSEKAAGGGEIRPEMLKSLAWEGIIWLTRMCQLAFKLGKTPKDWQTGVIIPFYKRVDHKQCTNYRGISLLSLPGKLYAKCLERRHRQIVEPALEDGQYGFRPGCSNTDQIFTMKQILLRSHGSMPRTFLLVLLIWKRHMTGYFEINFGGYFRNMALMVSCCWLLSHFTVNQKLIVFV